MPGYSKPAAPDKNKPAEGSPLTKQAGALWAAHRKRSCALCPVSSIWMGADGQPGPNAVVCMFGNGAVPAKGMIVGDMPTIEDYRAKLPWSGGNADYLYNVLEGQGIDPSDLYMTQAVKCLIPKTESGYMTVGGVRWGKDELATAAVKVCGPSYLELELAAVQPKAVLAVGAQAYYFFSKKGGITKQRGQAFMYESPGWSGWVVPTVSPQYVFTNPSLNQPFESDVAKFGRLMEGRSEPPKVDIIDVRNYADFRAAMAELAESPDKILTFDLETRGFLDYKPRYSKVWLAAFTKGVDRGQGIRTFMIPLEHPESPFQSRDMTDGWEWNSPKHWQEHADELGCDPEVVGPVLKMIASSRVNGHNVKFDLRNSRSMARRYGLDWKKLSEPD